MEGPGSREFQRFFYLIKRAHCARIFAPDLCSRLEPPGSPYRLSPRLTATISNKYKTTQLQRVGLAYTACHAGADRSITGHPRVAAHNSSMGPSKQSARC